MKWKIILLLVSLVGLCSCYESKYEGYSVFKGTTLFKLHTLGEDDIKPAVNDFIVVQVEYRTESDSLFYAVSPKIQVEKSEYPGSIDDCFTALAVGDSATFLLDAHLFFQKTLQTSLPSFVDVDSKIKVSLKIKELQTYADFQKQKEDFLAWIADFQEYERVQLTKFIENDTVPYVKVGEGLYKVLLREGEGASVESGDTVVLHYEGKFLNGKYFDSTKQHKSAFTFVYGREWQLIEGLEEAVSMMKEGEKSVFILQSDMAFGAEGSSTGIIPPYTSLIYEVELLKVGKLLL